MQTKLIATILAATMSSLLWTGIILAANPDAGQKSLLESLRKKISARANLNSKMKNFTANRLLPVVYEPILVSETIKLNRKKVSLKTIKGIDKKWKAAKKTLPIMSEKLNNTCAKDLKRLLKPLSQVVEAFVMDNQGAVVCENSITSDYWQGDEAKWKNSYNGGKGGLDSGKPKIDASTNYLLQQVSLPVVAPGGKVVGAITFGVDTNRL